MSEDLVVYDAPEPEPVAGGEPAGMPEPEPEVAEVAETPEAVEDQDESDEVEKPHKKSGSQRWKEKAAREAQEKEYWKQQALSNSKPEAPKAAPVAEGKPRLDDFETHEAWVEAVTDWKVEQKMADREAKSEAARRQQTWEQKAESARAKFEDFDDALESAAMPSRPVAEVLSESPIGAELAYHLATNPKEYARINALGPIAAARELGLIEARLDQKSKPAAKAPAPVTKAPKPPTPVGSPSMGKPVDSGRIETY